MNRPGSTALESPGLSRFDALDPSLASEDDATLAELIESDGRELIRLGRRVELDRYLRAAPGLFERDDPLDAAIDVTLRSRSGGSRVAPEAVEDMVAEYPHLERPIREAAALNAAIWSTTGLRARVSLPPPKAMPADFGPLLLTGERRYRLESLLGQGAFSQVYLARDRQLSEEGHSAMVAIKILMPADRSPRARERLVEEATKVRRISHPNVVLVLDRGVSAADEDFIVYEYVDGGDLAGFVGRRPMPVREAASLIAKIARGVHAAHAAGVIHCDLKPHNIMLTTAGEPKVVDFGIAVRLSETGGAARPAFGPKPGPAGSIAFISPEQYRGEDGAFSIQSDIYALGGILYLLLTGRLPNGSSLEEIAATHHPTTGRAAAPAPRLHRGEVGRDLDAICRRAMAVKPAERYDSAAALADDLDRCLKLEPLPWTRPGKLKTAALWARRKPALAITAAMLMMAALAGAVLAWQTNVAHIKLAKEAEQKAFRESIGKNFVAALTRMGDDYRSSTEALTKIWAAEYLFGPQVLGLPDQQPELWQQRIRIIREIVTAARTEGRGNDLETLIWETALAFWLVNDGDHREAEPLIEENRRKLAAVLSPADEWLIDLGMIAAGARVNRVAAAALEGAPPEAATLAALARELDAANEALRARRAGTPMHYLVLDALARLRSPALLNDPEGMEAAEDEKAKLLNIRRGTRAPSK